MNRLPKIEIKTLEKKKSSCMDASALFFVLVGLLQRFQHIRAGVMESSNVNLPGVSQSSADGDVKIADPKASNKLDVMISKQFNRLTFLSILLVFYTFASVIFLSVVCNTIWNESRITKNKHGKEIDISFCRAPKAYMASLYVVDIIGRCILINLCVAFTIRIIRTKVRRTREQVWTVAMIIMTAISYSPTVSIVVLNDQIIVHGAKAWIVVHKWVLAFLGVTRCISLVVSSVGQLFYVWANSHSFGILNINDRPSNLRFYAPKIVILGIYNLYRVVLIILGIARSKLPGSTLFALLADFKILKSWKSKVFLQVGILAIIELIIMIAIIRRMYITANVLRGAPYVKHRGKQIGFRYFVMSNIIAYSLFLFADISILILLPRGFELSTVWQGVDHLTHFKHFLYNAMFGPVPRLLNYATTAMAAYVDLPADSVGVMGWFKGSEQNERDEKAPITLKVRSKKSDFNVNQMSFCVVFDLLVELFNFSDVAYMKKSKAVKIQMAHEYTNAKGYYLELEIFNEVNETYATIFTAEDQIIVAFKGTTTLENMKTDINMKMVGISNSLPSKKYSNHTILSSLDGKNAKIHKGFAEAYSSVSDELIDKISALHATKERPIYFTGHSLGASLATIASLDVILSLGIKDVYVLTFGSPRYGNIFWSRAYDEVAVAHWRVAIRSDIVTTLPRAGYSHVGKRAALTTSGELFLDPNAIETMLWSSVVVNVSDHGKPAYKKALTLFSNKYLPGFEPEFIPKEGEAPASMATTNLDPTR